MIRYTITEDIEMKQQAYCEFIKPVNFKNGYIVQVRYPIEDNPAVMITDVAKDNWQLPLFITDKSVNKIGHTIDVGNPKIKTMSKEDFYKTFRVTLIEDINENKPGTAY